MGVGEQDRLEARIAGYRIIRRLGAGTHSTHYLGHAEDPGADNAAVIVKVFEPSTDHDLISDEVAALTEVPHGGLPRLVDLATLPDDRVVLVLERLAGPALSAVLERRTRIAPGEAVTILAPLIVTLSSLHELGFAHTTLSQATVRFQADGRPFLTGLGGLRCLPGFTAAGRHNRGTPHPPDDAPSRIDVIRADYGRLALLMRSVFDRLPPADATTRRGEALLAWFEMAATVVPFQRALEELERRLFDWSPAAAVRLAAPSPAPASAVPARLDPAAMPTGMAADGGPPERAARAAPRARTRGAASRTRRLVLRLEAMLEHDPVRRFRSRIRAVARARRGPMVVLVCVATAVTVLALTLMSPPSTATPRSPVARPGPSAVPASPGIDLERPDKRPDKRPDERPVPSSLAAPPDRPALTGAIAGDDPVRAATALLAGRLGCLAAASVSCLASFEQTGSALLEADSYAIEQGTASAALRPQRVGELVERTGNFAIVALWGETDGAKGGESQAASLLLVKGEAGWRLRQVFD